MAASKKKGSSSSSGKTKVVTKVPVKKTVKTNTKNKQKKKAIPEQESFTEEIFLWGALLIAILLFISNFGVGGRIGNVVSSVCFGIFGLLAYLFPIIFVIAVFFFASNKGNRIAVVKLTAMILFSCFLCMFIELIVNGEAAPGPVAVYKDCYADKIGGGFIGGLFAWLICPNFGLIGAYVINIIGLIVSLVLITERSAFKEMQKSGQKVYETARISNEKYREAAENRKEERKLRRIEQQTKVAEKKKKEITDEISELHIESHMDFEEEQENIPVRVRKNEKKMHMESFGYEKLEELSEIEEEDFESVIAEGIKEFAPQGNVLKYKEQAVVQTEKEDIVANHRKNRQSEAEIQSGIANIEKEIDIQNVLEEEKKHIFPSVSLLKQISVKKGDSRQHLQETANKLQQTLKNFGVNVTITNVSCGPSVTRYELQPEMGVKVSKIVNLADDIKLNLAAADIRIEAPIPGKAAVGIEVPNKENVMVSFRELIESQEFKINDSNIAFCVGRDIAGKVVVTDIAKMPHLLIAGATGSGKSVCINTIIMSILYKADPKDVKLIMIDPKVVELSVYNGIPHLMIPVVTDPKKAAGALHWAVAEMTDRYEKFAKAGVRDLKGYNEKVESIQKSIQDAEGEEKPQKLPQIVIIVDELADLMMVASNDVEEAICRLAQLARACGIHLIIATQRPSVNVITGLIKANMPSRIAFAVTSGVDSRTILDMNGAEKLLGKGDMLFNPQGVPKPIRIQGAFVSDKEVLDVVEFLKEQNNGMVNYSAEIEAKMNSAENGNLTVSIDGKGDSSDGRDSYFTEAAKLLVEKEKGSIGMLQRYFKVGFNRAARIMDQLEEAGIVGPEEGTKPRKVLMSPEQFEQFLEECL